MTGGDDRGRPSGPTTTGRTGSGGRHHAPDRPDARPDAPGPDEDAVTDRHPLPRRTERPDRVGARAAAAAAAAPSVPRTRAARRALEREPDPEPPPRGYDEARDEARDDDHDDHEDDDALTDLLPGSGDSRSSTGAPDAPDAPDEGDSPRSPSRRRRWVGPAAVAVLLVALLGGAYLARGLFGAVAPPDFPGPGTGGVVVAVGDGDLVGTVAGQLAQKGVVASARAFSTAAEDDPRGRGISPGYYLLRREMSAQGALDAMLTPGSRLGRLEVRGGLQLDDTVGEGSSVVPGVLSLIARATCAPDPSGTVACRSRAEIEEAMTGTDPAALGVPAWAVADVTKAEPRRRLEGLIVPGVYDVPPGSSARDALTRVVRASAVRLESAGLTARANAGGLSAYQTLVVASIAEKEGVEKDFGKIARVIDNRLPVPMRLQMDSTINFPLDRQTLLTTPVDRATPGPYNTYVNFGLPPTPIGAPSSEAVAAAVNPEPGPWVYFVKCEPDGTSCFAVTQEEHDANRRLAQERGAY